MRYKVSFEKALEECANSPDFLIQLKSGNYIYIDSYFCLNQPKYIRWDKTTATMTAYARGHKSECCLPFTPERVYEKACKTETKPPSSERVIPFKPKPKPSPRPKVEINDPENISEQVELFKTEVCDMEALVKTLPRDLPGTVDKLIAWQAVKEEDLAESSNLSEKTIQRLRRHEQEEVSLETVIQLCIGLHLPPILSDCLLGAAGKSLMTSKLHTAYKILLNTCYSYSVEYCNALLAGMGLSTLGRKKAQ